MIRALRTRLGFVSILTAGSLVIGCGSDDGGGSSNGGNKGLPSGDPDLGVTFSPMYSAYVEGHTFRVPVTVLEAPGKINFRALDESMVTIERTGDSSAMLTMKKAGQTTIIAETEDGSSWGKSELYITEGTEAELELGRERYENGVEAFPTPEGGFTGLFDGGFPALGDGGFGSLFADGGFRIPDGGFAMLDGGLSANPESACTYCHKPAGQTMMGLGGGLLNIDVEHTPQQIGGYSDDELITIFTKGMKPEGVPMRLATSERLAQTWSTTHQWQMEEAAKKGIVLHIRSLPPEAQGEVDFLGGLFRGDGGFMLPPGLAGLLDGGLGSLFRDGGFVLPPGLGGGGNDAGTTPPEEDAASEPEDSGTAEEDAASQDVDAGQGVDASAG